MSEVRRGGWIQCQTCATPFQWLSARGRQPIHCQKCRGRWPKTDEAEEPIATPQTPPPAPEDMPVVLPPPPVAVPSVPIDPLAALLESAPSENFRHLVGGYRDRATAREAVRMLLRGLDGEREVLEAMMELNRGQQDLLHAQEALLRTVDRSGLSIFERPDEANPNVRSEPSRNRNGREPNEGDGNEANTEVNAAL